MRMFVLLLAATLACAQNQKEQKVDMQAMMAAAKKFTQPGERHKFLERFLGAWNFETRVIMNGVPGKGEKGEQTCDWLIKGRFVHCKGAGMMMGMNLEFQSIMGYDNFKQSYRVLHLSSMDTAMNTSEGDLTPDGKVLITYGTIDEYLTGEHDKMVRYVWRLDSADAFRFEVHDLPIGEKNTQVVGVNFTRKK